MGTEPRRSTRGAELLGFLSFGLALMLLISLATFNPHDPAPFFRAGATGPARNFIGPAGAFLAELLVPQLFGVTALLLPLVLGLAGWKLFWCKPIEAPYTKGAGLLLMLLSLTAFATLTFGTVTFEAEPVRAGGAVGELLAALLIKDFNRTGAYIVVATTLFVSLILSTQFSFATLLNEVGARTGGRFQSLRTAWAHYRETRRKEKMRREVIRKHTQKEAAEGSESLPRVRKAKSAPGEEEEGGDPRPEGAALHRGAGGRGRAGRSPRAGSPAQAAPGAPPRGQGRHLPPPPRHSGRDPGGLERGPRAPL
jgi:DNA segregation ATPase FtsK/SpoIIIE, S-DNA-T family